MKASFMENEQIRGYISKLHIWNYIDDQYVGPNFLEIWPNTEAFFYWT
jgi:hypothetical protein